MVRGRGMLLPPIWMILDGVPHGKSHTARMGGSNQKNAPYSVIYSQIRTYWCVFTDIVGDLVHILAWGTNVGCVIQPP